MLGVHSSLVSLGTNKRSLQRPSAVDRSSDTKSKQHSKVATLYTMSQNKNLCVGVRSKVFSSSIVVVGVVFFFLPKLAQSARLFSLCGVCVFLRPGEEF